MAKLSAHAAISGDKKLRKFLKRCKQGAFTLDTKKMMFDIGNMHRTRLARNLKTKTVIQKFQVSFIDADLQNIAYRARIVEIKMNCFEVLSQLDQYISLLKKHLKATYAENMKVGYGTQADRDALIDSFLEPGLMSKKKLEATMSYADLVILDIDQAGFALKRIITVMQIAQEKRSSV